MASWHEDNPDKDWTWREVTVVALIIAAVVFACVGAPLLHGM